MCVALFCDCVKKLFDGKDWSEKMEEFQASTAVVLESLPPEAIPNTAVSAAIALAVRARPDLELDPENPKVARGTPLGIELPTNSIAFKPVRADSLLRIQNEAAVLMRMAKDCQPAGVSPAGPNFAAAWQKRFETRPARYSAKSTSSGSGSRCPACFSTPCSPSAIFGLPESIFTPIRIGGNLMVQTHNHASLTSDFDAWLETLAYASGVFASEAVARTWSIQFPWPDRPDFHRSGLPMRALAATMPRKTGWAA